MSSPQQLHNLSPEKYGRAAFTTHTYTPSKLHDNILFREATTLKKIEEESHKARQFEALNSFLKERLAALEEEKQGIEDTLTQQIHMYKKMLQELNDSHQAMIVELQRKFRAEILLLIAEKEEEAKYNQSEKEAFEAKIQELETEIARLNRNLKNNAGQYSQLTNDLTKITIQHKNISENLESTKKRAEQDVAKLQQQLKEVIQRNQNDKASMIATHQQALQQRRIQKEKLQEALRADINKLDVNRSLENSVKTKEMKELSLTFEGQTRRLNDMLASKDRIIDALNKENNKDKAQILELTRDYQARLNAVSMNNVRLQDEANKMKTDNICLLERYQDLCKVSSEDKTAFESTIASLKRELELNQFNYIRDYDRQQVLSEDLHKQSTKLTAILHERDLLAEQNTNFKQLLLETSFEIEQCRKEFLRTSHERDEFIVRVQQLTHRNEQVVLHSEQMAREILDLRRENERLRALGYHR